MTKKQKEEIALFRFGVICDLVGTLRLEYGDAEKLIKKKSEQSWSIPGSMRTRIAASTIRNWVKRYQKSDGQFSSLYPSGRSDKGRSRKVDDETILAIVKMKKEKPSLPAVDQSQLTSLKSSEKKILLHPESLSTRQPFTVFCKKKGSAGRPQAKLTGGDLRLNIPTISGSPILCMAPWWKLMGK